MPYRRLPKTDEARLKVLKKIVARDDIYNVHNRIMEWKTISEVQIMHNTLHQRLSKQAAKKREQKEDAVRYNRAVKTARTFISHFIQVLNFAVIRGEVNKKRKILYGLDENNFALPDLSADEHLLEWGEKIVKGERDRLKLGEVAIQNPTIAKVAVQYDIFADLYLKKQSHQAEAKLELQEMKELREKVDEVVLTAWNEIERAFKGHEPRDRIAKCAEYGIIYYYRKGEIQK